MSLLELRRLLRIAQAAVREASKVLRSGGQRGRRIHRNEHRDIKIAADKTIDRFLVGYLRSHSPLPILSEESCQADSPLHIQVPTWIVDPIDGSFNYSRNVPLSAISLGLWLRDIPLIGVIYDPIHDELFAGIVGRCAWLNGRKIRPSNVRKLSACAFCTGLPVSLELNTEILTPQLRSFAAFKKVRMFGTAALSLAYVACGRIDAYAEREINIWDVAAGVAIVQAAGGRSTVLPGRTSMTRVVMAHNSRINAVELKKVLGIGG